MQIKNTTNFLLSLLQGTRVTRYLMQTAPNFETVSCNFMTEHIARKTGRNQAIIFATVGLLLATLTFYLLSRDSGFALGLVIIYGLQYTLFSIERFTVILIIIIYANSFFFGKIAGEEILIKQKKYYWVGLKYGLISILMATSIPCVIEYLIIGVHSTGKQNLFKDFYVFSLFPLTLLLSLPSLLLTSFLFSKRLKQIGKRVPLVNAG